MIGLPTARNASREAVRFSEANITSYVKSIAPGMDPNAFTVTTTWTPDNEPGRLDYIQVDTSAY